MSRSISLVSAFIFLTVSCTYVAAQLKDHSRKGPAYAPLKGVRLKVSRIEHAGSRPISIEGGEMNVSIYNIVTREPVPFESGIKPYNNVIKDIDIHYELMVGRDRGNVIHDKLIGILKEISSLPVDERNFSRVGLSGSGKDYLLFSGPHSMPNYVWFDGRIVVVWFVRLGERREDRALNTETFWKGKIGFFPLEKEVRLESVPKTFAADFLKRYADGEFERPKH